MGVILQHERDNIYRLDVAGRLHKRDLDAVQRQVASEIGRAGPIRLLIVLTAFEGWEQGANWRDLTFYVRHGDDIERIAIVADERWESETLMFAAADLRKGAVAFFPVAAVERAAAWVAEA